MYEYNNFPVLHVFNRKKRHVKFKLTPCLNKSMLKEKSKMLNSIKVITFVKLSRNPNIYLYILGYISIYRNFTRFQREISSWLFLENQIFYSRDTHKNNVILFMCTENWKMRLGNKSLSATSTLHTMLCTRKKKLYCVSTVCICRTIHSFGFVIIILRLFHFSHSVMHVYMHYIQSVQQPWTGTKTKSHWDVCHILFNSATNKILLLIFLVDQLYTKTQS